MRHRRSETAAQVESLCIPDLNRGNKIMNYCNVPVVRFYVEGDDGLNYEADDDSSFDDTDDLLNTLRIRNPTEKFYMLAVIDA
jgi:hypothetical protein